ncbi:choice-of-anchor D domain-containing protein [Candidatus Parabeggiatoa sp. HSG14]|uniref:choice-of-anchor D domain-containing protein n=1 Tax=Candidatus Parabeggiatoa sp. HSG14 TaxID=3055593 RepID=UPI0025A758DE|nr:choice-of-anchor D domain-containing protein [Thiotrichales bacterium HSG14]
MSIKKWLTLWIMCFLIGSHHVVLAQDTPKIKVSPGAVNFGNQPVKIVSAEKTITLTNTGKVELKGILITLNGTDRSLFRQSNSTCESVLAVGASCKVDVTFTPKTTGDVETTLTVKSKAGTSPDEIKIQGTGIIEKPSVKLSPASLDFKDQAVKETNPEETITLTNNGKAELKKIRFKIEGADNSVFSISKSSTCGVTLAPKENCKINLIFKAKETGPREAILTMTSDAESSPDQIALQGNGVINVPAVKLNSIAVDFKEQAIKETSPEETITLTNNGKAELNKIRLKIEGTDKLVFSVADSSTCSGATLAPKESCKINLIFKSKEAGTREAVLTVNSNVEGSPNTITLKGNGVVPFPLVELTLDAVDFKEQLIKSPSREKKITLKNNGTAELKKIRIKVTGKNAREFSLAESSDCGSTLAVKANCKINLTFTPRNEGTREATLSIVSDAEDSPHEIALTGIGVKEKQPDTLSVKPALVDFGNHAINVSSDEKMVTLKGIGEKGVRDIAFMIEGANKDEFVTVSSTCQDKLGAGKDCSISFTFTPTKPGIREATLMVNSDTPSGTQEIILQGTGISSDMPIVNLTPASVTFKQNISEPGAERTVTLSNNGEAELTGILISIEGDIKDNFVQQSDCGETLAGGEACDITLIFTPTEIGTGEASLTVTSNASTSPDTLLLKGISKTEISQYPSLGKDKVEQVEFSGGVALIVENEEGELISEAFEPSLSISQGQPFVVSGVINAIPEEHLEQSADILVIAFYAPENILENNNASPKNCSIPEINYYMKRNNDFSCENGVAEDISDGCEEQQASPYVWDVWNGSLAAIKPLKTISLPKTVDLSEESDEPIFKGSLGDLTGHFCFYFAYQLQDGTLMFNGETPITLLIQK